MSTLSYDPSRTGLLRRQAIADFTRRLKALSKDIREVIAVKDAFGLNERKPFVIKNVQPQEWAFRTDPAKIAAFRNWLQARTDAGILAPVGFSPSIGPKIFTGDEVWMAKYLDSAYKQAMLRAYRQVHGADIAKDSLGNYYLGGADQFLQTAFAYPELTSKIQLIYTRAYNELKGISDTIGLQMSRILADGLVQGDGPLSIARKMNDAIGILGRTRANTIARTEIIHAHAEGMLDGLQELGVDEVHAEVEISTAGDERVCLQCFLLIGQTMTIDEARGMIPVHPNCRCSWIPVSVKKSLRQTKPLSERSIKRPRTPTILPQTKVIEPKPATARPTPSNPVTVDKMRSDPISSYKEMGGGVNESLRVTNDFKGIYKTASGETECYRQGMTAGSYYLREEAAYIVNQKLGMDLVPPTVVRELKNGIGSIQQLVDGKTLAELSHQSIDAYNVAHKALRTARENAVFDFVIGHVDRHAANLIYDKGKFWAIDNGLSMPVTSMQRNPKLCHLQSLFLESQENASISQDIVDKLVKFVVAKDEIIKELRPFVPEEAVTSMMERASHLILTKTLPKNHEILSNGQTVSMFKYLQ